MSIWKTVLVGIAAVVLALAAVELGYVERLRELLNRLRSELSRRYERLKWKVLLWELDRRSGK